MGRGRRGVRPARAEGRRGRGGTGRGGGLCSADARGGEVGGCHGSSDGFQRSMRESSNQWLILRPENMKGPPNSLYFGARLIALRLQLADRTGMRPGSQEDFNSIIDSASVTGHEHFVSCSALPRLIRFPTQTAAVHSGIALKSYHMPEALQCSTHAGK